MTCKFVLLLFCYFLVQLHQEGDDFVWYCSLRTDHRVREASRISFRYGAVAELIGSHRQVRVFHAVAKKEQKEKHKGAVKSDRRIHLSRSILRIVPASAQLLSQHLHPKTLLPFSYICQDSVVPPS